MTIDSRFIAALLLHPIAEMDIASSNSEKNYGGSYINEILHARSPEETLNSHGRITKRAALSFVFRVMIHIHKNPPDAEPTKRMLLKTAVLLQSRREAEFGSYLQVRTQRLA